MQLAEAVPDIRFDHTAEFRKQAFIGVFVAAIRRRHPAGPAAFIGVEAWVLGHNMARQVALVEWVAATHRGAARSLPE